MFYQNPIIKGFNPDPSICYDGTYFYLVTSTFEFFPGVPIYRSQNLINWELVGHCLTRDSQLPLAGAACSGGIYAPTIRYHQGTYYMITTNVTNGGHFIVHTRDPLGEWSEPAWIDRDGIDPSLLFDDDKVYFVSTTVHNGRQGIRMCEIDPDTGKKRTEPQIISYGTGHTHPEAPHVYKIGDMYYLMLAEGGTEYGHMITLSRASSPYGPYEPCPHGPILSHRDYGPRDIACVGHGDWIQDGRGSWWLVCLGVRPMGHPLLHNLGRETFLAPVRWEDGWPIVGDNGHLALTMEGDLPGEPLPLPTVFSDDFQKKAPAKPWNFVCNPVPHRYQAGNGCLVLRGENSGLDTDRPTLMAVRQTEFSVHAQVELHVDKDTQAGLTAFYNKSYYYALTVEQKNGHPVARLEKHLHDSKFTDGELALPEQDAYTLHLFADRDFYRFCVELDGKLVPVGQGSTAGLCTEGTMTMTFTGTMVGLFAARGMASFRDFRYEELSQ